MTKKAIFDQKTLMYRPDKNRSRDLKKSVNRDEVEGVEAGYRQLFHVFNCCYMLNNYKKLKNTLANMTALAKN